MPKKITLPRVSEEMSDLLIIVLGMIGIAIAVGLAIAILKADVGALLVG